MKTERERNGRLIAAIQDGLPLVPCPYGTVGGATGMSESEVLAHIKRMKADGTIKRFGVVVRHHELGYRANAMVVWDVPDEQVSELGRQIAAHDFVTLCYRRARHRPEWPYNLYCMIHGRDRAGVLDKIAYLIKACGLEHFPSEVLFSRRRFKQHGARYLLPGAGSIEAQELKRAAGA